MSSALVVLFLSSFLHAAPMETKEFDAKGLKKLAVENSAGEVRVTGGTGSKVIVRFEKAEFGPKCVLEFKEKNHELGVRADQDGLFQSEKCKVNFHIEIPAETALRFKVGSGGVKVEKTKGELDLKMGSGEVNVNAEVTKLDVLSGSGTLNVEGLVGPGTPAAARSI